MGFHTGVFRTEVLSAPLSKVEAMGLQLRILSFVW